MSQSVDIQITGLAESASSLRALSSALANRVPLHQAMAADAVEFTRAYVAGSARHATAQRLGAKPTGFRERAAKTIEPASTAEAAIIRIPRKTGLARAFGDIVLVPQNGRKYLTIPAMAETYGRSVRDFPEGTFVFSILAAHRQFAVLRWREDGGKHRKGDVAYWLRRSVTQKKDRTLLPDSEDLATVAIDAASRYFEEILATSNPSSLA